MISSGNSLNSGRSLKSRNHERQQSPDQRRQQWGTGASTVAHQCDVELEEEGVISAFEKPPARRKEKNENAPLDFEPIVEAFEDAHAMVSVVYQAFQTNGRDGPAQVVLHKAIEIMDRVHEMLDKAASQIERLQKAVASGGAS
jgi:hypothetical protein